MTTTRILIVEDELIIARGLEKRLKALGYDVVGLAANGEAALRRCEELRPDLVLMDIHLGRSALDGIDVAQVVSERMGLPVIFLTAHSDQATLERAKLTEPFGYVLKPYEDRDLQTAIEIARYRHQMERRLRENEQWLAATLASIGDGVIATDEAGRVRLMNTLAERLTGWTEAEARNHPIAEVFVIRDGQTGEPVPNPIFQALATRQSVMLPLNTVLIQRGGARIPVEDSASPIHSVRGHVAGAVLVFRDVTERHRLEELLRQAQKMEAIGRLAGGIAHDFNNIMTAITGFSELLLDADCDPPTQQEFLRQIHTSGKRAAALTQQILAFSRKQILLPTVLDLNAVVGDMAGMIRRLIGERIEFDFKPDATLSPVKADPTQMGQVVLNLAVNARDAMPAGGSLRFETRNDFLGADSFPSSEAIVPGDYAVLSVIDTGTGMPPEVQARIFEPFFTTKGVGQGTGLGLSAVLGILRQSGGYVRVQSAVGVGTRFDIYLPAVPSAAMPAATDVDTPPDRGVETILLVEDDAGVRQMTRMILQSLGYCVLEAVDGVEAMQLAGSHGGVIDLLMTDLIMPRMTGVALAEKLCMQRDGLRVLFMSGYTEEEVSGEGLRSDAVEFLQKPFDREQLSRKLREVLQ